MAWTDRFEEMHAKAAEQADLSDFGPDEYHEGLRQLLASLDTSPARGPAQDAMAESIIVGALVSRLRTQAEWAAHPGYKAREIPAPLIVIGVPRTGTTALHNLLSQDPQFQGIENWLTSWPTVRPPRAEWDSNPHFQEVSAKVEAMYEIAPEMMIAHGVRADEVDECLVPLAQSFTTNYYPSQVDIPDYDAWYLTADEEPAMRRYKDVLRLVGLNDDRRWLLKNPTHVFSVEAVLAVFPDAGVVQTHRHPADSLASLVNLLANIIKAFSGQDIDRKRRLDREAKFWAEAVKRSMAAQDRQPDRFVNVLQRDIRRDPLGVVNRIYSHFGLDLSSQAEAAMRDWAARNSESGGAGHDYEAIERRDEITAMFADYVKRYEL